MSKADNPLHRQTSTGFIYINGSSKTQQPIKWQWLTQRNLRQPNYHEDSISYNQKKRILTGLDFKSRPSSTFKLRGGFNMKEKVRAISTASCTSFRTDKKLQPFVYLNSNSQQMVIPSVKFGIDTQKLIKAIKEANKKGNRIVGVISIRRLGLRYKLNHTFVEYKTSHEHDLKEISNEVKSHMKEYNQCDKQLYFYSTKGFPLHNYKEIAKLSLKTVIVDQCPKLQLNRDILLKVLQLSQRIEVILSEYERIIEKLQASQQQTQEFDEQGKYLYQDVKTSVQKTSQNPELKLNNKQQNLEQLLSWYQQKFTTSESTSKELTKNLLFESKNHYPKELSNKRLLSIVSQKVQNLQSTVNKHKLLPHRMDLMMEQVKRENLKQKNGMSKLKLFEAPITKKDMLVQLQQKNSLLSTQNIPYLIDKYGLNRFQLYSLYNLYKSFEKIAVMRNPNSTTLSKIADKGIDRQTFEVGLKGLDMNPGDQLIKNICYFGDFISWQQFLKIISISLRKTPQEKLTAILKGISSFDNGYLTRHQISLMIGNSLYKLFDQEQNELKEYFTNMAMAEFDPQKTGRISAQVLKEKVLGKGSQNLNMVSFLILNT